MIRKIIPFLIILFLISFSCDRNKNNSESDSDIVAYVNTAPILLEEIDKEIKQELYDELNRIYFIRKVALEEKIKDKILALEAKHKNLSVDELIDSIRKKGEKEGKLKAFIERNGYNNGIPVYERTIKTYPIKSSKGEMVLKKKFEDYLIKEFIDSLKSVYQTDILLTPPISPLLDIKRMLVHYEGDLNSKVTLIIASDFDCHMCREQNPLFERLYEKYKDKVRFGFTHYGPYVSTSAIASECAANQGKFGEMRDSIFKTKTIPDSVVLFRIAKNLKLDMSTFSKDYKNKEISDKIHENLVKLESAGIYGTPTIMINNRLIFNNTSLDEIEKLLKKEIEKTN